jgi:hypothetical protein
MCCEYLRLGLPDRFRRDSEGFRRGRLLAKHWIVEPIDIIKRTPQYSFSPAKSVESFLSSTTNRREKSPLTVSSSPVEGPTP